MFIVEKDDKNEKNDILVKDRRDIAGASEECSSPSDVLISLNIFSVIPQKKKKNPSSSVTVAGKNSTIAD